MSQHDAATTPETAAWSTPAVDTEVAIDYWRSMRRKAYVDVALTPYGPNFSERSATPARRLRTLGKVGERENVNRSRVLISRGSEDKEYLYALFQSRVTGVITQAGHTAEIRPGQIVIYGSGQPFSLDYKEPHEQVVVHLPVERAFADVGLRPSTDLLAVTIPVDGALSSVSAFLRALLPRRPRTL